MKTKLGLYIHIPFCQKKCKYCDFNSFQSTSKQREEYLQALVKEIQLASPSYKDFLVDSIFIGGGSPSILQGGEILQLGKALRENFNIDEKLEFTIEANPNTTSQDKLLAYKEVGINRLSFGGQSFDDKELEDLGRVHQAADIFKAIKMAKDLGFKNISLDLMLGIPGQSLQSLKASLESAVSLDLQHLSVYSLILEENTELYRMYKQGIDLSLPDEDLERNMYYFTREFLKNSDFVQYEISNFSKVGFQSKHNLKYWSFEDYLGLGLGSHSKISDQRFFNKASFSAYIKDLQAGILPIKERENLSRQDQINEYIFMGLRKTRGFSYKLLEEKFDLNFFREYDKDISKNLDLAYIEIDGDFIRLSNKGLDFSNQVELDFFRL